MEFSTRTASFNQFKNGSSRVLISSNVTARGIDIQQVGVVINFITRRDIGKMKEIERHYATETRELPIDNLAFLS
jgi:superfamily II DNA/RNA helicase